MVQTRLTSSSAMAVNTAATNQQSPSNINPRADTTHINSNLRPFPQPTSELWYLLIGPPFFLQTFLVRIA